MGFTIVFTARGVRETERPVSFIPKGALTHHPQAGSGTACGSRALSEGDAAPAGAYGQCHISAELLHRQLSQTQPPMRL